ncbi:MAG: response regulator, partial [Proteobacteria bacterium]
CDVILMDMQMPEMDGLEATQHIRKYSTTQPVIVALTANAMLGDSELCRSAGMNDYLPKPVNFGELYRMIAKWAGPKSAL